MRGCSIIKYLIVVIFPGYAHPNRLFAVNFQERSPHKAFEIECCRQPLGIFNLHIVCLYSWGL